MNHSGKCKYLHGHSVKASITVKQEHLNSDSMVCDFSELKDCAQNYVDQFLDHNFLLHNEDPLVPILTEQSERFMAINEHPTAEVLSKMIFQHLKNRGFNVDHVDLWETASACASYRED